MIDKCVRACVCVHVWRVSGWLSVRDVTVIFCIFRYSTGQPDTV